MRTMSRKKRKTPGWLEGPITLALRSLLSVPLLLPVDTTASLARAAARKFATSRINRKKFPRALKNLRDAYPDWPDDKIHSHAVASYEHLFQLGLEVFYAPRLVTEGGFTRHLGFGSLGPGARKLIDGRPCIMISGHCGNWELIGYSISMLGFPMSAVYRPLDLKPLDRWIRYTRERQGLNLVSKFGAMKELPIALRANQPVGFVADQNGGDRGVFVPFFGRLTSTYKSIGLLAMQHNASMICGFARRLRPEEPDPESVSGARSGVPAIDGFSRLGAASMRYRAEVVDVFGPEDWNSHPDPLFYLTARYRRAIETMVRSAPEQYLWMHRVWRSRPPHERAGKPFPEALKDKLRSLPWMTEVELARIIDRSDRDAAIASMQA